MILSIGLGTTGESKKTYIWQLFFVKSVSGHTPIWRTRCGGNDDETALCEDKSRGCTEDIRGLSTRISPIAVTTRASHGYLLSRG